MSYYVYVMQNVLGIKVGMSNDPVRRKKEIELYSGLSIVLIRTFEFDSLIEAIDIERNSHGLLSNSQIHGEWFRCSVSEAIAAIERSIRGEKATQKFVISIEQENQISPDELFAIIYEANGRIKYHDARKLVYPLSIGNAVRTLRSEELIESWSDVLVLNEQGWALVRDSIPDAPLTPRCSAGHGASEPGTLLPSEGRSEPRDPGLFKRG